MADEDPDDSSWHAAITQRVERVRDMLLGRAESILQEILSGIRALVALNLAVVKENLFDLLLRMVRIEDKQDVITAQNVRIIAQNEETNRLLQILVDAIPQRATSLRGTFEKIPRQSR